MSVRTVLIVRFTCPREVDKEEVKRQLVELFDILRTEPTFAGAVLHDHPDQPNNLVVYETWAISREQFMKQIKAKPYWNTFEAMLSDRGVQRQADLLVPVAEWSSRSSDACGVSTGPMSVPTAYTLTKSSRIAPRGSKV